ncbi:MAG: hypothetical protein PHF77_01850 [Candidatus Bipolaricaulis anaerobius]|nr:hypothetical protein [Candidatus Bipolaricaulis anaerobius]
MRIAGAILLGLILVGTSGLAVGWETMGQEFLTGAALGYVGGVVGAQVGSALVRAAGWGTIGGNLVGIVAGYMGYALGSTLGAGIGVAWTGLSLGANGDVVLGFLGATAGTGLAFGIAALTDWEWAFYFGAPLASLGATLGFSLPVRAATTQD